MSLSHLMRSAASIPLSALCSCLLCCAGTSLEALAKVWLQRAVSQASTSWGSGTSRAVARTWYGIQRLVPFRIWMLFTAINRQQLCFLPTTAKEGNHKSASKQQGSKQPVCPDIKGWKGNTQQLFQTVLWYLRLREKWFFQTALLKR